MNKLLFGVAVLVLIPVLAQAAPQLQPMQLLATPQPMAVDFEHCVTATGSHINRDGDTCIAADGVSYERSALQDTGGVNWSDVLRRDPSITLSRGH